MKTSQLLLTALLGLGLTSVACAQTTVPGAPSAPLSPSTTGAIVPGQPGTISTPLPTTPVQTGTAPSTIYAPGTDPADASGTLRANQPVGATPATTAPARSVRRGTSTTRTRSTSTPVRP